MVILCRDGGVDGIEIHACHGDFVQQSWSKWSNQRTDKWGEPMYFVTRHYRADPPGGRPGLYHQCQDAG